jgi:hypothetical protein
MEVSMATDPPMEEWTQAEIDALYANAGDPQPISGLQIMTEAEVMKMCTIPQEMCGDEILTLRRHRKIRRRGRARPGKGQGNLF